MEKKYYFVTISYKSQRGLGILEHNHLLAKASTKQNAEIGVKKYFIKQGLKEVDITNVEAHDTIECD